MMINTVHYSLEKSTRVTREEHLCVCGRGGWEFKGDRCFLPPSRRLFRSLLLLPTRYSAVTPRPGPAGGRTLF